MEFTCTCGRAPISNVLKDIVAEELKGCEDKGMSGSEVRG